MLADVQSQYQNKNKEFSNVLLEEGKKISTKRDEADTLDKQIKALSRLHAEERKILETEASKSLSDITVQLLKEKADNVAERDKMTAQVEELRQFEIDEADLDRKAAELAERLREETGLAEAKKKEYELEAAENDAQMIDKLSEGKEIENERKLYEKEKKTGIYELESNKFENQKTIDVTRKQTQEFQQKNKGNYRFIKKVTCRLQYQETLYRSTSR